MIDLMARKAPRRIKIVRTTRTLSAFQNLPQKTREAFLLIGLMQNDIHWLIKLLFGAMLHPSNDEPEILANKGLNITLSTILISKIYEAHKRIKHELNDEIENLLKNIPADRRRKIVKLRNKIDLQLGPKYTIYKIRNIGFHYPSPDKLDFKKFRKNLTRDTATYSSDFKIDSYSHTSTVAYMKVLAEACNLKKIDRVPEKISEITRVTGWLLLSFFSEILGVIDEFILSPKNIEQKEILVTNPGERAKISFYCRNKWDY